MKENIVPELIQNVVHKLIIDLESMYLISNINELKENEKDPNTKAFKMNMEIHIFEAIISTLHSFLLSKNTEIDVRVYICIHIMEHSEKYMNFSINSDLNSNKLMLCFNYEILFLIFNSKFEYFAEKIENYLIALNSFCKTFTSAEYSSKLKGLNIFIEKLYDLINCMEEKIKRYKIEKQTDKPKEEKEENN